MCTADQIDVVLFGECRNNLLTEGKGDTSVIFTPSLDVLIWIGPEQVTKESCIRNICGSHYTLDLLKGAELWTEPTMHAEDLLIDNGCNG